MSNHLISVEMFLRPTKIYSFFSYNSRLLEKPFKKLEKVFMPAQSAGKLPSYG